MLFLAIAVNALSLVMNGALELSGGRPSPVSFFFSMISAFCLGMLFMVAVK